MTSRRPRVLGISRNPAYSPCQHAGNDAAILEATLREFERTGWVAARISELDLPGRPLPPAEVYLNMGQSFASARILREAERGGIRFFNRPSSVLRCHRHRMVAALAGSDLPFPASLLVRTDRRLGASARRRLEQLGRGPLWLKRGGVHAEREGDVCRLERADLDRGLGQLAARAIPIAAIQAHVEGPVVKFYGLGSGAFFHAYLAGSKSPVPPDLVGADVLRELARQAAVRFRLDIFGGDVVVAAPGRPVLIDLNDWPSFAPVRGEAARAIARYVQAVRLRGVLR